MTDNLVIFEGRVALRSYGDASDVMFLDSGPRQAETPFAEDFTERVGVGKQVSVRVFSSENALDEMQRVDMVARMSSGVTSAEFDHSYSETTGYLWTNETAKVGGHDLLAELSGHVGMWARVEVTLHD